MEIKQCLEQLPGKAEEITSVNTQSSGDQKVQECSMHGVHNF